jgi:lipopolysaccharide export system permease protein
MPWVLHRHLLRSVFFAVMWAVTVIAFIIATVNVLRDLLLYLLDGRLPLSMFFHLAGLLFPFVITIALPVGMLLGVLLVLGRLSADNEILAMRSAGLSLLQIVWPLLVFAGFAVGFGLVANFYLMPRARVAYHAELDTAVRNSALNFIKPRTFVRDFPKIVFYCNERNGDVLKDFWIWHLDDKSRVIQFGHAAEARLAVDVEKMELTPILYNAEVENRERDDPENFSKPPQLPSFGVFTKVLPLDTLLGKSNRSRKPDWMTLTELRAESQRLAASGAPASEQIKPALVVQNKINSALAIFTFTLVGIPLGIRVQRKETSANLGVALLLVLAYHFSSSAVGVLDKHPALRPDLLMWIPNILFVILGLRLMQLVQRV